VAAHGAVWDEWWTDVVIEGTSPPSCPLNLFQLLAAAPRHDNRVSIPKLSQGLLTRVTCFGTEIFYRSLPDIYSTTSSTQLAVLPLPLDGARRKASEAGYEGRCSLGDSTGDEVTPVGCPAGWRPVRIW